MSEKNIQISILLDLVLNFKLRHDGRSTLQASKGLKGNIERSDLWRTELKVYQSVRHKKKSFKKINMTLPDPDSS